MARACYSRAGRMESAPMTHHTLSFTETSASVRTLGNGITLVMEPLPYLHSVAAGIWIKTGSANERPEQAGISHFLEHLFFKGTASRTARQLMEAVESKGGHVNAFTSREHTCLYAKMLASHLAGGIEILADIFKNSLFCDLDKERNVILEEIASNEDVPEDHVHDLFAARIWPGHPLGRAITGTMETVSAIRLDDVQDYYATWYRPENVVISVAGNFDEDALLEQVRNEFEGLAAGPLPGRCGAPTFRAGADYVTKDIAQNHVCFGFPGATATSERRYVYDVLSSILGSGPISRLFERIRENEGLAYSIYTFNSSYLASGMLGIYAAVAPENLDKTFQLAFEEIRRLREEPVGETELETNREQLKGSMLMALESTSNRMTRLAKSNIYHGRVVSIGEVIQAVEAVTADDLQQLAQELFQKDRCTTVVLGPSNGGGVREPAL